MSLKQAELGADLTGLAAEPTPEHLQKLRERGLQCFTTHERAVVHCVMIDVECLVVGGVDEGDPQEVFIRDPDNPEKLVNLYDQPFQDRRDAVRTVLRGFWQAVEAGDFDQPAAQMQRAS